VRGERCVENHLEHCVRPLQDVVVPKPQNAVPLGLEPLIAASVSRIPGVLTSIELDHQLVLKADKVRDVRANRLLSAELHAGEVATSQPSPKQTFGVG